MFADNVLIVTIVAAFLIAVLIGPLFIPFLRRLKFGQAIREEGPQSHYKKAGTPPMGGTIILLALIFTVLKFANANMEIYFLLLVTLGYGLIGFLDDFIKIRKKRNLGLTAKEKFAGQILLAIGAYVLLLMMGHDTSLHLPGTPWKLELGYFYFDQRREHYRRPGRTFGRDRSHRLWRVRDHCLVRAGLRHGDFQRRRRRGRSWLPRLQRASGPRVHGRHRLARFGGSACGNCDHDENRAAFGDYRRRVRRGDTVRHFAGRFFQNARQTDFPHESAPSSF